MQLFALMVLLLAGAFAGRRLLRARVAETAPLKVVARAGLTQKSGLALIESDGRRLLVGYGGEGAPVVLVAPHPEPSATPAATPVPSPTPRPPMPAPPAEIVLEDLVEIEVPATPNPPAA